jgi:hypothetical protein
MTSAVKVAIDPRHAGQPQFLTGVLGLVVEYVHSYQDEKRLNGSAYLHMRQRTLGSRQDIRGGVCMNFRDLNRPPDALKLLSADFMTSLLGRPRG